MTTNKPPYGATCTDQQHETHVLSKHDSHAKTNQTSGCEDRPSERCAFPAAGGWLQETSLLYRLTGEAKPRNCDEISVTQANGSRSIEARTLLASELLGLLRKSATELIAVDVCQASSGIQNDNDLKALIDRLDGLRDSVDDFRDAGPVGSGWKSGELIDQIAALDEAIRTLRSQRAETEAIRTGYSAARLEIESLKAQLHAAKQINAAQFGLLTSSIPGSALRASHGQAPAQAAPAYKDSTPELHIGDSAFESWYSTYSPAHKSDKQRARDAYAAGMGDPLVTAAPAAVAGPWSLGDIEGNWRDIDHKNHQGVIRIVWKMENDERTLACEARALAVVDALNAAALTTQPAPPQDVSAAGGDSFLLLPTRPTPDAPANTAGLSWDAYSGAQMLAYGRSCSDAALVVAAHQPSPAAQGDALDTMRLDWLDADVSKCVFHLGKSWYTRSSYGMPYRKRANLREAIDAARAAQEGKSHE